MERMKSVTLRKCYSLCWKWCPPTLMFNVELLSYYLLKICVLNVLRIAYNRLRSLLKTCRSIRPIWALSSVAPVECCYQSVLSEFLKTFKDGLDGRNWYSVKIRVSRYGSPWMQLMKISPHYFLKNLRLHWVPVRDSDATPTDYLGSRVSIHSVAYMYFFNFLFFLFLKFLHRFLWSCRLYLKVCQDEGGLREEIAVSVCLSCTQWIHVTFTTSKLGAVYSIHAITAITAGI